MAGSLTPPTRPPLTAPTQVGERCRAKSNEVYQRPGFLGLSLPFSAEAEFPHGQVRAMMPPN